MRKFLTATLLCMALTVTMVPAAFAADTADSNYTTCMAAIQEQKVIQDQAHQTAESLRQKGYDDSSAYIQAAQSTWWAAQDEIVAYLLKPISMAELTEELRKIHDKIEKRLASLTRPQGGAEALRMVTATMLLDEYARPEPPAAAESLRSAGMEIRGDEHIVVAAFSLPDGAHPELLPMAERIFSRAFSCCGFSSGDRTVLLLASGNGFGRLYASLDELRQATRRAWGGEALAGLSKEYASLGEGHAAYLEAMEALKIARRGGGLYAAGGWDDMAMLCARALKIIEKEYMDEELSLQSVSERLHISANYLGANIKKFYGDTFMNLLIQKRMDVALKLLWGGSSRIAEVSRRCGYADQSYFGYCFKKYYGKSPARMRQEQKEANA